MTLCSYKGMAVWWEGGGMRPTAGTVKTIGGWKSSVEWTRQCKGHAGEKGWGSRRGQATAAAPKKINLHAWGGQKE